MNFSRFKKTSKKHNEPLKAQNLFVLENKTLTRLTAHILLLLLMIGTLGITITLRDNLISKQIESLKEMFLKYSSAHGLSINDIVVQGREKTTLASLNKIVNLNRNDNILKIDLKTLKNEIEDLPWVEKAELKRLYFPNILQIYLKEKDIIALYQKQGKFYPVDIYGNVIDVEYIPNKPFLVIVGEGAPEKLFELIKITSSAPDLFARIKAASLHANRRWDLIFDDLENGITVKMPEENLEQAWQKLIKIHNKYGIFKRKLTFIDLRYTNKVTVNIAE